MSDDGRSHANLGSAPHVAVARCPFTNSLPDARERIVSVTGEAAGHGGELPQLLAADPALAQMSLKLTASVIVLECSEDVSTKKAAELLVCGGLVTHVCSLPPVPPAPPTGPPGQGQYGKRNSGKHGHHRVIDDETGR